MCYGSCMMENYMGECNLPYCAKDMARDYRQNAIRMFKSDCDCIRRKAGERREKAFREKQASESVRDFTDFVLDCGIADGATERLIAEWAETGDNALAVAYNGLAGTVPDESIACFLRRVKEDAVALREAVREDIRANLRVELSDAAMDNSVVWMVERFGCAAEDAASSLANDLESIGYEGDE